MSFSLHQLQPVSYTHLDVYKRQPNTMTKLRRDEEVSLTILSKICKPLHADFGDIVEAAVVEQTSVVIN